MHDALVDQRVLALAGPQARLEFAGKRGGKPSAIQADISERLVALARAGQRVLRLKGGDPFVFGRGGEEAMTLAAAGVPFRVIPGVTAGLAALAAAAIPATLRGTNRAVIFAAGHGAEEDFDWAPLARTGQPIVLYMVMHNLERIAAALMEAGLAGATPAAVIASATTPKQRVLVSTLEKLAADAREQKFEPPAIVVIGEIVRCATQLLGEDTAADKDTHSDRARAHHRRAAFRRRQDDGDAGRARRAGAARRRGARGQSRTGLHRPGVPCRRDRRAERQSRLLGDAATAARRLGGADRRQRGYFYHRRRDGPVRRRERRMPGRRGATADLAAHFDLPVVLVLDVARQAQSAAAVVRGFAAHDPAVRIAGVILNRVASESTAPWSPARLQRSAFRCSAPCRAKRRSLCRSGISVWCRPASMPISPR